MKHWKHVGPYNPPSGPKWINECIKISGHSGASIIIDADGRAEKILVVNGQQFELVEDER